MTESGNTHLRTQEETLRPPSSNVPFLHIFLISCVSSRVKNNVRKPEVPHPIHRQKHGNSQFPTLNPEFLHHITSSVEDLRTRRAKHNSSKGNKLFFLEETGEATARTKNNRTWLGAQEKRGPWHHYKTKDRILNAGSRSLGWGKDESFEGVEFQF